MIERNWQELIRPEKPQIDAGADPARKARLEVDLPANGPRAH